MISATVVVDGVVDVVGLWVVVNMVVVVGGGGNENVTVGGRN